MEKGKKEIDQDSYERGLTRKEVFFQVLDESSVVRSGGTDVGSTDFERVSLRMEIDINFIAIMCTAALLSLPNLLLKST